MNFSLNGSAEVTVTPAVTFTATEVKLLSIVDSPEDQIVQANIVAADDENGSAVARVTLWEGETYASHADFAWTRTDVEARLRTILLGG